MGQTRNKITPTCLKRWRLEISNSVFVVCFTTLQHLRRHSVIRKTKLIFRHRHHGTEENYEKNRKIRRSPKSPQRFSATAVATDLGRPYWIYIIPTHDMNQWLLLQFLVLLMMDAESVRNMYSDLAVTNKQYCQSCMLFVLYIIYTGGVFTARYGLIMLTLFSFIL